MKKFEVKNGEIKMDINKKTFIYFHSSSKLFLIIVICLAFAWVILPSNSKSPAMEKALTKESVIDIITKRYINNTNSPELMIYETPMPPGTIIKPAFTRDDNTENKIECKEKENWLFVADFSPGAAFEHEIEIGIINNKNKETPGIIKAHCWPVKTSNGETVPLFLSLKEWEKFKETHIVVASSGCIGNSSHMPNGIPTINIIGSPNDSSKLWAIVICGVLDPHQTYFFDAFDMYSTIIDYGVPANQVFFIIPANLKSENSETALCRGVSIASIQACIGTIKKEIHEDEKFLFFISSHGRPEILGLSNSGYNSEELDPCTLNGWLKEISCKMKFVIISACKSGTFVAPLTSSCDINDNRIIITSCKDDEDSVVDLDNSSCDLNNNDRGSEFLSGFIESFSNKISDTDKDNRVSMFEAFSFAKLYALCSEKDNSQVSDCNYEPKYSAQIKCTNNINPKKQFLFWK
jgi:hypothetical protein